MPPKQQSDDTKTLCDVLDLMKISLRRKVRLEQAMRQVIMMTVIQSAMIHTPTEASVKSTVNRKARNIQTILLMTMACQMGTELQTAAT